MALCQIEGHPDMYGLGIRLAFYIQWFGALLIQYVDETELPSVRILGLLLSAAVTVALVVQVAGDELQAVDIYIVLLFAVGIFLFFVPIYLWRLLTCCKPYWNPSRWSKEQPSPGYRYASFVLLIAIASIGIWYYTAYLPGLDRGCEQYGFFFSKVNLENKAFIALSAIFYLLLLFICIGILLVKAGCQIRLWSKVRRRRRVKLVHIILFHELRLLASFIVFGVLVAAIELTIQWNRLKGINAINTSAQTIPLFLSLGFIVRVVILHLAGEGEDDSSSDDDSIMGGSSSRRPVMAEEGQTWPQQPPGVYYRSTG